MDKYINVVKNIELFSDISSENIVKLLNCTNSVKRNYPSGGYITQANDGLNKIAVIVSGRAHVISEDFCGNTFILTEIGEGEIFGESYAIVPYETSMFSVVAQCDTTVIFIDVNCIRNMCSESCACHLRLINNLLGIIAKENIRYMCKIEHMSHRSIRQKLLSYFSEQMKKNHSSSFYIPFNRQQLADYLCVDRSAMSYELSKMQKDNLIKYKLNHFELLNNCDTDNN